MASLNKVQLIGYLGDEPKMDTLPNGAKKATLSVATTERGFTTKSGSVVPERTEWHRVIYWDKYAEFCEKYVHKGSSIYVEGKLHTRSWDDQNGLKRYSTEIDGSSVILLDKKQDGGDGSAPRQNAPQGSGNGQGLNPSELSPEDNPDDLPF